MIDGQPDFSQIREYPSIKQIRVEFGDKTAVKSLKGLIENFNLSMNVVRPMNAVQLNDCAFMMLSEYPSYRLEDIVIMFNMAKTGKLGKIMDRVDIETICRFLAEYDAMRTDYGLRQQEQYTEQKESEYIEPEHPEKLIEFDAVAYLAKLKEERRIRKEQELKEYEERHHVQMDEALKVLQNYQTNIKPKMKG